MLRASGIFLVIAALACACSRKPSSTPPGASPPVAQQSAPPPAQQRSDPACAAPIESSSSRGQIRTGSGTIRIGALAGLKDAGEENVTHLRKLVAELVRRGAEALVADGDVGDNLEEQQTLLGVLTETGLPVVVAAGNREVRSELDAAENELRKKGAKLWDLSHVRMVDVGDALLVGLPGTFDRRLLHADGACIYGQRDIDALATFLDRLPAKDPPAVLVMAVPPRGRDKSALDATEAQNVGDPRILPLLTRRRAPFGIFGEVWEAGGRAIDGSSNPVPPGTPSEQLYLNPGAADRTEWPMIDGTRVAGQAALLTIQGRKATMDVVRVGTGKT